MTSTPLPPPTCSLLVRLTREWAALASRPAVVHRAVRWNVGVPFRSLDELVEATGFRRRDGGERVDGSRPEAGEADTKPADTKPADTKPADTKTADTVLADTVLARLLLAARYDDLAARVVLQRLLPGVVAIGKRWQRRCPDADPVGELVAAAWQVIRTYPVERRPHHLAAQLLRDTEYHAFVRPRRRVLVHELMPTDTFERVGFRSATAGGVSGGVVGRVGEPGAEGDAATELAELVAVARRSLLTERDEELLGLLLAGRSTVQIAAELGTSVRTVGNRRDGLVSRLRQTARVLAAA